MLLQVVGEDELKDLFLKGESLLKRTTDPEKSTVCQKHNLLHDKYNTLKVQKFNHIGDKGIGCKCGHFVNKLPFILDHSTSQKKSKNTENKSLKIKKGKLGQANSRTR